MMDLEYWLSVALLAVLIIVVVLWRHDPPEE